MDYGYEQSKAMSPMMELGCSLRQPTTRERLEQTRKVLTEKLSDINDALAALDSNPEFERVHNLIQKAL